MFTYVDQTGAGRLQIGGGGSSKKFWPAKRCGSMWVADNGETTIAVTLMGRQDFRTSWGVVVTEIDGDVKAITGLHRSKAIAKINQALYKLAYSYLNDDDRDMIEQTRPVKKKKAKKKDKGGKNFAGHPQHMHD